MSILTCSNTSAVVSRSPNCLEDLVTVDTFFISTLMGAGKIDLTATTTPEGGSPLANSQFLRFICLMKRYCCSSTLIRYIYTVLSNSKRDFYQYPSHHPDEPSLHLKGIEHQITKVGYLTDKPIQNIQKDPKLIPRMYELKYAQTRHRLEAGIKL